MKPFPRSRPSSIALCVVLGLGSSACVRPDAPSVGMSKVEASLVFGVSDIPQPVPTPVEQVAALVEAMAAPARATREVQAPVEEEKPFEFAKPATPRFAPQTAATAKVACPEAPVTAAPLVAPQPRITGDPRPGVTKWRETGYITVKNFETQQPQRQDFDSVGDPRLIRNFKRLGPQLYTFEEVVSSSDDITVTTYQVNNGAVTANPSDGVGIVATPGVGEPERGIVIKSIRTSSKQTGQLVYEFAPTGAGLLMLPLPVVAGERFTSTAVDPRSGQVISHDATVQERQRIDACGELIDGWGVDYMRRQTGESEFGALNATVDIEFHSVFATQYGGVPILRRIVAPEDLCNTICPLDITERVGQVDPSPLDS